MDNTLKANTVKNLKYLSERIYELHLDEEFEGHNYEVLDDIDYIIACQIIEASKHLLTVDKETHDIITEANKEVRRQNCGVLPTVDETLPMVNDTVELLNQYCSNIMQGHIRNAHGIADDQPIYEVVEEVDYGKGTIRTTHGYVFGIDHVKIVKFAE